MQTTDERVFHIQSFPLVLADALNLFHRIVMLFISNFVK